MDITSTEIIGAVSGPVATMEAVSAGIIGGADGPTAIFVTGDPAATIVSTVLAVAIALLILKYLKRK